MDLAALGQHTKKLHPGHYDSHADEAVGRAMVRRFPGVYDSPDTDANTVPETSKTLQIQLSQLKAGKRKAVMAANGANLKIRPQDYGALPHKFRGGTIYFNPRKITRAQIIQAIKERKLNAILGDSQMGYGAPNKENLKQPAEAVIARSKSGETAHSALTDKEHEKTAVEAADRLKPDGGSVSVEPPAKEIAHRLTKNKKFRPSGGKRWPKAPEKK